MYYNYKLGVSVCIVLIYNPLYNMYSYFSNLDIAFVTIKHHGNGLIMVLQLYTYTGWKQDIE